MRELRVKILTLNNLQILGNLTINIPLNDYHFSLADWLNSSRNFITLSDVEVYSENQQLLTKMPLLCINKPAMASVSSEEEEFGSPVLSVLSC